jgi:hypothetical protein
MSKFLGTNSNSFEANWILELDLALDLSLHLSSSNHELFFLVLFLGSNQFDFPSKMVPHKFSLDLPLFGFGLSSKGCGSNLYWLLSKQLFYFIGPRLYPNLKWPLLQQTRIFFIQISQTLSLWWIQLNSTLK